MSILFFTLQFNNHFNNSGGFFIAEFLRFGYKTLPFSTELFVILIKSNERF